MAETLLEAMRAHAGSAAVAAAAIEALASAGAPTARRPAPGLARAEGEQLLCRALESAVAAVRAHPGVAAVAAAGCECVGLLCRAPGVRSRLGASAVNVALQVPPS